MPKLALVGEAYGEQEAKEGKPFVGAAGKMLDTLLRAAGVDRADCFVTNVFNQRPPDNDVTYFFGPKKEAAEGFKPLRASKWLKAEFVPELERLRGELSSYEVIVPLGGTALWALTGYSNISIRRGAWHDAEHCLPTYHPAAILRQYIWFPLAVSDLAKAKGLSDGTWKSAFFTLIPRPTYEQVCEFLADAVNGSEPITFDIETSPKFRAITCIGIGCAGRFMCIPLSDEASKGFSYWPDVATEVEVLRRIKQVLEFKGIPKIAHHSSYDVTWLHEILGIKVAGPLLDTRIIHHGLMPELPHSLASIAHTYMILPPWKALRKASKEEQE